MTLKNATWKQNRPILIQFESIQNSFITLKTANEIFNNIGLIKYNEVDVNAHSKTQWHCRNVLYTTGHTARIAMVLPLHMLLLTFNLGYFLNANRFRHKRHFGQGSVSIYKNVFPDTGIPMLKIRRSWDRLIFNMGIPILVRRRLHVEWAPRFYHPCVARHSFLSWSASQRIEGYRSTEGPLAVWAPNRLIQHGSWGLGADSGLSHNLSFDMGRRTIK